jgi:hypothetical protein
LQSLLSNGLPVYLDGRTCLFTKSVPILLSILNSMCDNPLYDSILNDEIADEELLDAIKNLKNNKSPRLDNILNEYLKNSTPELTQIYFCKKCQSRNYYRCEKFSQATNKRNPSKIIRVHFIPFVLIHWLYYTNSPVPWYNSNVYQYDSDDNDMLPLI